MIGKLIAYGVIVVLILYIIGVVSICVKTGVSLGRWVGGGSFNKEKKK